MAELVITTTDGRTERHLLAGPVTLGRDPTCEIPLDDLGTSRHHARIRPDGDGYVVEDLGSKNGTLLNDVRCKTSRLGDGDVVLLGSVRVVFVDGKGRSGSPSTGVMSTSITLSDHTPSTENTKFSRRDTRLLLPQQRLKMLYDLFERLTRLRNRDELLEEVLDICFETLHFERGAIAVRRPDGRGVDWPVVRNLRGAEGELTVSRSVLGRALDHGERALINDTGQGGFDPTVSMVQLGIRSALCVPVQHHDQILGVIYGDRTTTGAVYTEEDMDFLAALAKQVSIGLVNTQLMEEREVKRVLEREVALAREIQQRLFPRDLPERDNLCVAARNDPGRFVSGDYYDVIELDGGRVAFLIADVTGEGVAAALLMSNLQAAVRMTVSGEVDPAKLLDRWNRLIYDNTDASKFVTALIGVVDPANRRLLWANAGHHPPYVLRATPEASFEIQTEAGYPLGVVEDADFVTEQVELGPEPCTLFCYTDGVIEAMDMEGAQFSHQRMIETLHQARALGPEAVIQQMHDAIAAFTGEAPQSDDITMLALRLG